MGGLSASRTRNSSPTCEDCGGSCRLGILSNSFASARERETALYHLHELAEQIIYTHKTGTEKPDPRTIKAARTSLEVRPQSRPSNDNAAVNDEATQVAERVRQPAPAYSAQQLRPDRSDSFPDRPPQHVVHMLDLSRLRPRRPRRNAAYSSAFDICCMTRAFHLKAFSQLRNCAAVMRGLLSLGLGQPARARLCMWATLLAAQ
ncbi:hypothetical protein GCM10010507_63220 [Streptomyces cinnamoneus]|uniref:Uncharacterized protein n=1 Tax=Streptomyces cinnamoneus TaxID=53446 RepID=A0A918WRS9_STRCJ|nr:hypothetical protein GCM10010507_63220 [Streptomyces cinnamoneus]